MIGKNLNNRYKIERRIGKGAFGEVFRAHDSQLKRDVAIKMLSDAGYEDAFKKRFIRESESMAKLMHPNIVTVFDFGEFNLRPFIVMEYVDGIPLLDVSEKASPDIGDVLRIASQVCNAMSYAHSNGIIHRDLTMKNVHPRWSGRSYRWETSR